jgi:5-(carboxyamino)imidazole ribonucleotide mutase
MPAGIAVGTLAIGPAGATNAAIMAAQILGLRPEIAKNVADFRTAQTDKVASNNIPGQV